MAADEILSWIFASESSSCVQTVCEGTTLLDQRTRPVTVHLVLEGLIKLTRSESSLPGVVVALRMEGSLIGATPAILELPSSVAATTLTRSRLMTLSVARFSELLLTSRDFSFAVNKLHCREIDDQHVSLSTIQRLSARKRLQHLFRQFTQSGLEEPRRCPFLGATLHRYEIAQLIGVTPEHLSRLLKAMEVEGSVYRHNGWITFTDDFAPRARPPHVANQKHKSPRSSSIGV